jgi:very-short-patch-repair endonuclease
VTAIVTSAVLQDKTVLFASRNNKALQIVEERFKRICPDQHALIRVGGNYDKECCELLERMGNLPLQDTAVPFHRLMESIELHLADLDALDKIIDTTAIALGEASLSEERFSYLKKKFLPGDIDAYEKVKAFDAKTLLRTALILEKIVKRTATWPTFLANVTIRGYRRSGEKDLKSLQMALKAVNIRLNLKWPGNRDELQKTLKHILAVVDLVTSAQEMAVAAKKIGDAAQLESVFEKIVEHKQSIVKKIPGLLLSKVRENSAGRALPETTEDALLQYRDIMPQLRGTRLNEEQRNVRLSSLGGLFPDLLKRLPAWAVTNLSASSRIPLEPGVFDLVIIDEASQCDIPSCIPLLYRARQAVIIGDPLQLPQITQISQVVEDQFLRQNSMDGPEYNHLRYSEKSIYDAARRGTPRVGYQFLSNHYRCHPDIIQFANSSHWYEDRLEVFTDVGRLKRPGFWEKGVEWIQVNSRITMNSPKGYYLQEEVDRATDIVHDLLETRKYEGTVGVVCPLRGVVDRIRDRVTKSVHARLLQAAEFEAQTAHGFQGDERDVIVYVMAVHPEMPRGPRWFIAENRNLFNVALSRARAAFVVVGDMEAVRNLSFENRPVDYLRDFVSYVEALGKEEPIKHGEPIFSPEQLWEERFYCKALKPANLPVFSQYPLGPYKLDFALLRKNRQRKLDLEIDGETYHKDASGHRLRKDIDRDIFVKAQDGRSWDVMRFWVYELREDMESCLKKVTHWMNSAP